MADTADAPVSRDDTEKKGRGRPRKPESEKKDEPKEKRPRGRPRGSTKKPDEPKEPKKPRGRPRKAAGDVNAGQASK